jgi:hypothetical protein
MPIPVRTTALQEMTTNIDGTAGTRHSSMERTHMHDKHRRKHRYVPLQRTTNQHGEDSHVHEKREAMVVCAHGDKLIVLMASVLQTGETALKKKSAWTS